jgi:hypothetical protein
MKVVKIALLAGVLALSIAAVAVASGKPENVPPTHEHTNGNGPEYTPAQPEPPTPGPKAPLPEKAKAYGVFCRGASKHHEKGEKGTEFSRCVTSMARAAVHKEMAPGQACKGKSKKHEKGEKGTEFSRCVTAAAKLRHHEHEEEQQETSQSS